MSIIEVETKAFKITIETAFAILKAGKSLDAKTFADTMKCSLGTANKWLNKMTKLGILLRQTVVVSNAGIGSRKYVYTRNNSITIHYSNALQQRLFTSLLLRLHDTSYHKIGRVKKGIS